MKLKHIPIVLSLLGITVWSLPAQTSPSPAPATTPAPTAPSTTTPPANGGDTTPTTAPEDRPTTYTVVSGDTYWVIAHKFGLSTKALKKANGAKSNNLKPGQVLKIPALPTPTPEKTTSTSAVETSSVASTAEGSSTVSSPSTTQEVATSLPKPKRKKATVTLAQSTTRQPSSPTTTPGSGNSSIISADSPVLGDYYHPEPPHAKPAPSLVSAAPATPKTATTTALSSRQMTDASIGSFSQPVSPIIPRSKGFFSFLSHDDTEEQSGWAARFHESAEELAAHHIAYGQSWRPPGQPRSWVMGLFQYQPLSLQSDHQPRSAENRF